VLFGDAAAAVVVQPANNSIYSSYLKSKGNLGKAIVSRAMEPQGMFATDKENPAYNKFPQTKGHYISMAGSEVYRFAVTAMPEAVENACENAGIDIEELDLIIPHQANQRIIEAAAKRLGVGMEKMYVNTDRYGNTSCVSIPLCLAELQKDGRLKRGAKLGLVGFGAGLTYGSIIMEW